MLMSTSVTASSGRRLASLSAVGARTPACSPVCGSGSAWASVAARARGQGRRSQISSTFRVSSLCALCSSYPLPTYGSMLTNSACARLRTRSPALPAIPLPQRTAPPKLSEERAAACGRAHVRGRAGPDGCGWARLPPAGGLWGWHARDWQRTGARERRMRYNFLIF